MKNLVVSFVLFLVSFVGFSQSNVLDSLINEMKNSVFYTTDQKSNYISKYDFSSIYNGYTFINSIESKFGLDLTFVDFVNDCGFKDIVVEGVANSDINKEFSFITTLSVIEELNEKGILIQASEKYYNDSKTKENVMISMSY